MEVYVIKKQLRIKQILIIMVITLLAAVLLVGCNNTQTSAQDNGVEDTNNKEQIDKENTKDGDVSKDTPETNEEDEEDEEEIVEETEYYIVNQETGLREYKPTYNAYKTDEKRVESMREYRRELTLAGNSDESLRYRALIMVEEAKDERAIIKEAHEKIEASGEKPKIGKEHYKDDPRLTEKTKNNLDVYYSNEAPKPKKGKIEKIKNLPDSADRLAYYIESDTDLNEIYKHKNARSLVLSHNWYTRTGFYPDWIESYPQREDMDFSRFTKAESLRFDNVDLIYSASQLKLPPNAEMVIIKSETMELIDDITDNPKIDRLELSGRFLYIPYIGKLENMDHLEITSNRETGFTLSDQAIEAILDAPRLNSLILRFYINSEGERVEIRTINCLAKEYEKLKASRLK